MISPEQWDAFFATYSKHAIIKLACDAAGFDRGSYYAWMKRATGPDASEEDKAWLDRVKKSEADARDRILEAMHNRAIDGVEEPLIGRVGKDQDGVVCTVRKYSDALLVRLAQARMPELFKDRVAQEVSGPNGGPVKTETKVIAVPAIEEGAEE